MPSKQLTGSTPPTPVQPRQCARLNDDMERAVSKQLLEYAPRRGRRFLHRGYLAVTLMCFGLTALSWIIAARTTHFALPDPPPAGNPYWKQLEQDKSGFLAGCVGIPVFAFLGLFFLYGTFAAARSETAERSARS